MDLSDTEGKSTSGAVVSSGVNTRLSGSRLLMARIMWLALVLPSVGFFVAGLPTYYAQIQRPCVNAVTCNFFGAMTARGLHALSAIGFSVRGYATFLLIFTVIIVAIWCGIGFLIFWRRSDDWLALLAAFFLIVFITTYPGISASTLGIAVPALNPLIAFLSVLGQVSITLFFLLFPGGRLVPRWMGLILLLAIIQVVTSVLPAASPLNSNNWPSWVTGLFFGLIPYAAIIFSQIYRYRRVSNPAQRQQTKWVVYGILIVVSGFLVLGPLFSAFFPAVSSSDSPYSLFQLIYPFLTLLLPLSIGFAILRYRLYDIDVLINRTLVYGILTVLLTLLYFGLIFALQSLFQGMVHQSNAVAIVISTLVIAALFQPLRHRLQRFIDRRFYRNKYDAAKTVEAFSATLRNEVDLGQLREHLLTIVQETMQPAHVSLWLRSPEHDGTHQAPWRANPPDSSDGT
jgi:hypothetical protein